jgi:hypothetical protein
LRVQALCQTILLLVFVRLNIGGLLGRGRGKLCRLGAICCCAAWPMPYLGCRHRGPPRAVDQESAAFPPASPVSRTTTFPVRPHLPCLPLNPNQMSSWQLSARPGFPCDVVGAQRLNLLPDSGIAEGGYMFGGSGAPPTTMRTPDVRPLRALRSVDGAELAAL